MDRSESEQQIGKNCQRLAAEFLLSEGRDGPTNWRAFEHGKWKSSRPNFQIEGGNYLNISSKECPIYFWSPPTRNGHASFPWNYYVLVNILQHNS